MEVNKIYNEDCLLTMGRMPSMFVDLIITSPPYGGLREYNGYEYEFHETAKQMWRVIKMGGVLVWVIGDSVENGSETGDPFRNVIFFMNLGFRLHDTMIYKKNSSSYPASKNSNRYTQIF